MPTTIASELTQHLRSKHLHPKSAWLQSFLATTRPNTPLPGLKSTAVFRLLATDITASLEQPENEIFPLDILDGTIQSRQVAGPIVCQVLDIEDIGRSRWSQVEAIDAKERGETTKGREIVRTIDQESDNSNPSLAPVQTRGPFKLLLQDARGLQIYALDLKSVEGLNTSTAIGVKLILRDFQVRRAVVMLEPADVHILGGKIETLDKAWKESRKERLILDAKTNIQGNA